MSADAAAAEAVNPHFLDHAFETGASRTVEATEDIVGGNGMKLLAKGARVDPALRERLLQHKLRKPLEQCIQVVDGVIPERFGPIAEDLLERHSLLAAICRSERAQPVPESLSKLRLTTPIQSLLTIYGDYQGDRLGHSVGVAMLAMALARKLLPGAIDRQRMLALAGLVHDVGELYIDPSYLSRGSPLEPEHWRHIVTHPIVGHRVLGAMDGAGAPVADAVLQHHERLDGFGYPRGIGGGQVSLDGQILAAGEWLMGLIESGASPVVSASVATKLMPGEFSDELLEAISSAAAASDGLQALLTAASPLEDDVARVERIAATLRRLAQSRAWIDECITQARGEHKRVLESGLQRMLRIQRALSSTGLDFESPGLLLRELSALDDPRLHVEMTTIIRELEWRMRELERDSLLRTALLAGPAHVQMRELVGRLKGHPPAGEEPASAAS